MLTIIVVRAKFPFHCACDCLLLSIRSFTNLRITGVRRIYQLLTKSHISIHTSSFERISNHADSGVHQIPCRTLWTDPGSQRLSLSSTDWAAAAWVTFLLIHQLILHSRRKSSSKQPHSEKLLHQAQQDELFLNPYILLPLWMHAKPRTTITPRGQTTPSPTLFEI